MPIVPRVVVASWRVKAKIGAHSGFANASRLWMRTRTSAWISSGLCSVTHLRNSAGEPARVRDRPDEARVPGCLGRRLTPDCWGRVGVSQGDGGAERIRFPGESGSPGALQLQQTPLLWPALSVAEAESRVWAGFHYGLSTVVGTDMGRKIGANTVRAVMQPLN